MVIASIGIGNVGFAIANSLQKKGHTILIASFDGISESIDNALAKNGNFLVKPLQDAIDECDVAILAIPFFANEKVLKGVTWNGKTLVDCTNPVGQGISHGLRSEKSGSEYVQELAPDAHVVKAFSIYGYENLIDSQFPYSEVKPVMLIAGNDLKSKEQVLTLADDLGFYGKDTGSLSQALHLEHMTLLWVKMVRANGHSPHFVWAYLEK